MNEDNDFEMEFQTQPNENYNYDTEVESKSGTSNAEATQFEGGDEEDANVSFDPKGKITQKITFYRVQIISRILFSFTADYRLLFKNMVNVIHMMY